MFDFDYRVYHRPFKRPLQTHHGLWRNRSGVIVRLQTDQGIAGFGEIAPLPWFGTETLEEAIALCQSLSPVCTPDQINPISARYPATQFGLSSALWQLGTACNFVDLPSQDCCALLPTGNAAQNAWEPLWHAGHRTFKWKIATSPMDQELADFERLATALPPGATLRLDANGGLTKAKAQRWLTHCDLIPQGRPDCVEVEFLEQPLPPTEFSALQWLSQQYRTPIALDESVATLSAIQTALDQGWAGLLVVKPAIAGFFPQLLAACRPHRDRIVISSVFETAVGRQAVLAFAQALYGNMPPFALGLGTDQWFAADGLHQPPFEILWNCL
ncbi:MAG: o-succinylbenzoate synthase [Cyanobacteria bacterium J06635_15]